VGRSAKYPDGTLRCHHRQRTEREATFRCPKNGHSTRVSGNA